MPQPKKCRFKRQWGGYYTCPEPALEGSEYCILHQPNKTVRETELFKEKIKNNMQSRDYDFSGYHFPKGVNFRNQIFKETAYFTNAVFEAHANFEETTFEGDASFTLTTFKGNADFRKSTFGGDPYFMGTTFSQNATFALATFKGNADFSSTAAKADFRKSTFNGDVSFRMTGLRVTEYFSPPVLGLNFQESTFDGDVKFNLVAEDVKFKKSTFNGKVSFIRSNFGRNTDFAESTFNGDVEFHRSKFWSGADFRGITAKGDISFGQSIFQGRTNFKESSFGSFIDLKNANLRHNASAEEIFRVLKTRYQKQGYYTYAGEYYYRERIARRKQLPWYSPARWFEYLLLDGLCGYGERPLRAIRTGLGVLFGLALLYWKIGHIYPSPELFNEPNHVLTFWDALYFSVVTFTTLGFGDWRPDPSHWIRYVVMLEAFFGAFLMALFIVTFARRMMR